MLRESLITYLLDFLLNNTITDPISIRNGCRAFVIGKKIVTKIDQGKFKKMVLAAIIFARIKFILDGITAS
jgi:hypothetical protein